MLRYKLRTLLILLAVLPPLLWFGWTKYEAWRAERERQKLAEFERRLWLDLTGTLPPPTDLQALLKALDQARVQSGTAAPPQVEPAESP